MAVSPVIPNGILDDPCNVAPIKRWQTYEPVILYLQYTTTAPTLKAITKRYRGLDTECGFKVYWPPLTCIRQIETAASIYHHFALPTLPPGTKLYYRVTTDCNLKVKNQFTPPLVYDYPTCPTNAGFVKITRLTNTGSSNPIGELNNVHVAGNAALENLTLGAVLINSTGTWQGYSYGRFQQTASSPNTGTLWRIRFNGFTPQMANPEVTVTLTNNQTFDFLLNYTYHHVQGVTKTITVQAERVSGPSAIGRFQSGISPSVLTAIKTGA